MTLKEELHLKAIELQKLLHDTLNAGEDIRRFADDLLLFLQRLQDYLNDQKVKHLPFPTFQDIIYGLESNPDETLRDDYLLQRILQIIAAVAK